MAESFSTLLKESIDSISRTWVDHLYANRHTELVSLLSYRQLVDHLPDFIDELASLLDAATVTDTDLLEAAKRLRLHAQVRFQQGVLIDEVARELIILRRVLNDVLWGVAEDGVLVENKHRLREALRRTNAFVDEVVAQAVIIYAISLRPPVRTLDSIWPPPRRRKTDFSESDEQ